MSDIKKIKDEYLNKLDNDLDTESVNQIKTELFGKNGQISNSFKTLGSLPNDERKKFASDLNSIKDELQEKINSKLQEIEIKEINSKLENEKLDVTLPEREINQGKIHPVSQVIDEISSIFSEIGFSVEEGPDVENEHYNFTALNTPDNHPARDMHDTFYLDNNKELLLRTHTSPVQIRSMLETKPPLAFCSAGKVYRKDDDSTHLPMFHQVEGIYVDKDVNFANLKDLINQILLSIFDKKVETRFRPSYFPFTEPSAEVDILSEDGKWLEILGCGIVNPIVLKNCNIDHEKYTGFAFGLGIDRIALLLHQIDDIRLLSENDIRFLKQFRSSF